MLLGDFLKMTVICDVLSCDLLSPDDAGSKHLRNAGKILPDHTAQHPRSYLRSRRRGTCNLTVDSLVLQPWHVSRTSWIVCYEVYSNWIPNWSTRVYSAFLVWDVRRGRSSGRPCGISARACEDWGVRDRLRAVDSPWLVAVLSVLVLILHLSRPIQGQSH